MNKIGLLVLCSIPVFAENPVAVEQTPEGEWVIHASEESTADSSAIVSSSIPDMETPPTVILSTQDVNLKSEEHMEPTLSPLRLSKEQNIPLPLPSLAQKVEFDPEEEKAALDKEEQEVAKEVKEGAIVIDLGQVFAGSPAIYSLLFLLSMASVGIGAYALLSLRRSELLPQSRLEELKNHLRAQSYELALDTCRDHPTLFFSMVAAAIQHRHQGSATMLEMMKSEGRRISISFWQKINLLNEIAILAPMLGLLGTVLGMFYAFYDLNRSAESISALFDGLGVSVGTTVGGLVVAILALMFHSMTKYRLIRQLTLVEAEAEVLAQNIKDSP